MTIAFPARDEVVVRSILEREAATRPDEVLVSFEDGSVWTRTQALRAAYAAGNAFGRCGIGRGDRVAVFLPNGQGFLCAWWGLACIGAVLVPVNLAYRGSILRHLLETARCAAIVVDEDRAGRLDDLDSAQASAMPRLHPTQLAAAIDATPPRLDEPVEPWDIHLMALTSGTTGPSKLAQTTYWHTCLGQEFMVPWGFGRDDVYLVDLPLFHPSGIYSVMVTLCHGARFAVRAMPALGCYWDVARETGATTSVLVSSMITFLLAQPERCTDRDHSLSRVLCVPMPHDAKAFMTRFGIDSIATGYGSTEVPACIVHAPGRETVLDSCGRRRPGFEVRLVDEHDIEVSVGEVGEAIVRTELPWMMSPGYENNPGATAAAWRNGWFHTGDLFRCDVEGNYYFVDRRTDSLRRRRENISSLEVETEVQRFPGVAEAACVPAREPGQVEDEVKVWVVPKPDATIEPAELLRHCAGRMPHFMVPRYIEIAAELPKTPTAKVQKFVLRRRGNGEHTWDREVHGFSVTRHGLVEV